jgi:hypothetical protein
MITKINSVAGAPHIRGKEIGFRDALNLSISGEQTEAYRANGPLDGKQQQTYDYCDSA